MHGVERNPCEVVADAGHHGHQGCSVGRLLIDAVWVSASDGKLLNTESRTPKCR